MAEIWDRVPSASGNAWVWRPKRIRQAGDTQPLEHGYSVIKARLAGGSKNLPLVPCRHCGAIVPHSNYCEDCGRPLQEKGR